MRQTTIVKNQNLNKRWFVIDAKGKRVGKIATLVASYLRGKNKTTFTPNVDMGDYIVVVNAAEVVFSANKEQTKLYYSHSGYPGGLKTINAAELRLKKPVKILEKAIKGMLPHTKLGRKQFRNLFVYSGEVHNQQAQKPQKLEVN